MNWTVFVIMAYLFVAMREGLGGLFMVSTGWGNVTPHFEWVLVMFIALFAPARQALIAWAIMGVMIDLVTTSRSGATLFGPHALGYIAGGIVVVQLRVTVLRTHPLSHAFCTFCAGLAASLVIVLILSLRNWFYTADAPYAPLADLVNRLLCAMFTAAMAMVMTWPLLKLVPVFGLQLSRTARR